ncbi:N-acetyltransferase [Clostridia bacterium]|nr:N-acetyltransferase [Clostridia bacterium]
MNNLLNIREIDASTRPLVTAFINSHWFGTDMLIRGEVIDMTRVDGFVLIEEDVITGLVTYIIRDNVCEITSLDSAVPKRGVGSALVAELKKRAIEFGCIRLQLMSTNDNLNAIGFYQKRGFDMVGINLWAIDKEREQKPSIPLIGQNGVPMHHEIEFEMPLNRLPSTASEPV